MIRWKSTSRSDFRLLMTIPAAAAQEASSCARRGSVHPARAFHYADAQGWYKQSGLASRSRRNAR